MHLGCERRVIFDFVNVIQVLVLSYAPPFTSLSLLSLSSLSRLNSSSNAAPVCCSRAMLSFPVRASSVCSCLTSPLLFVPHPTKAEPRCSILIPSPSKKLYSGVPSCVHTPNKPFMCFEVSPDLFGKDNRTFIFFVLVLCRWLKTYAHNDKHRSSAR